MRDLFNDLVNLFITFQANINIRAIAQGCSEYNITVVLKREDCIRALRAVHSRFYLSKTTLAVGIIGSGLIGGTLLDQLRDQVPDWMDLMLFFPHFIIIHSFIIKYDSHADYHR